MGNATSTHRNRTIAYDALEEARDLHQDIGGPRPHGAILAYIDRRISSEELTHRCTQLEANEFCALAQRAFVRWVEAHDRLFSCQAGSHGRCDNPRNRFHFPVCHYYQPLPRGIDAITPALTAYMPDPYHTASYYNTAAPPGSNNTGGRGLGRDRIARAAHAPSMGRARGAVQAGRRGNNDSTRPAAHGHSRRRHGGQDHGTPQARDRGNSDTARSTARGRSHGGPSTGIRGLGSAGASRTASAPSAGRGPGTAQTGTQAGPTTSRHPRAESIGSASEFQFDDDDTRPLVHIPGQPRTVASRYRPRAASIGSASEFQLEDDNGSPVIHLPGESSTVAPRRRPRAASMGNASEYILGDDHASPVINLPDGHPAATERYNNSVSASPCALRVHGRPISTTSTAEGHRSEGGDMREAFAQTEPMVEPTRADHGTQASSGLYSDGDTNDREARGFGVTSRYIADSDSDSDSDLIEAWSDGDLENDSFIPGYP